jgi:putative transposase
MTHRVTRGRTRDQTLRWCAAALSARERQFRRVKGYRHLPLLKQALTTKLGSSRAVAA